MTDQRVKDICYMRHALAFAHEAFEANEVPVGAVVVDEKGIIIGTGKNQTESRHTQSAHAEIEALTNAGEVRKNWRLNGCTLYVTLEPCALCMNLVLLSRVSRVVFGACSPLYGYFSLGYGRDDAIRGIRTSYTRGVEAEQAEELLVTFFNLQRKHNGTKNYQ